MDLAIMHFVLAIIAGFGAGALFASDPQPPPPKDPPPGPPTDLPPKPCPRCPPMLGAIVGVGLWTLLGMDGNPGDLVVPAIMTGLAGGLFGGGVSGFVGLSRSR